jgi:RHS repeat-associated protein
VNFVYDSIAKRTKKLVQGGKTVLYLGDHYEVENGVNIKYIFGGNLRLAMIKGSLTYYYHKDHLGSTAAVTDETGQKKEGTTYEPFGSSRSHEGTDISAYKFTDQELDNETNLYNYDARLYDPVLGMFVTPDSIVPDEYDPQMLNRYAYCRNNPLIYTDPSGHKVTIEISREYPSGISTPGSLNVSSDVTGESFSCVTMEHDPFSGKGPLAKGDKTYKGSIFEHKNSKTGKITERVATNATKHEDGTLVIGGVVEIHPGVTVKDSTGCILAGLSIINDMLTDTINPTNINPTASQHIVDIIINEYVQTLDNNPELKAIGWHVKIDVKIINTPGFREYVREKMLERATAIAKREKIGLS